jgi:hypothetical protein
MPHITNPKSSVPIFLFSIKIISLTILTHKFYDRHNFILLRFPAMKLPKALTHNFYDCNQ